MPRQPDTWHLWGMDSEGRRLPLPEGPSLWCLCGTRGLGLRTVVLAVTQASRRETLLAEVFVLYYFTLSGNFSNFFFCFFKMKLADFQIKKLISGVPIMAQLKRIWLVSMRMRIRILASVSGLRIRHCSELWCRLAAAALIQLLAWELPYAAGTALKRQKNNNFYFVCDRKGYVCILLGKKYEKIHTKPDSCCYEDACLA